MNWRALEAAVDQKIAATFGESVRLSFMKKGAVDPDRPMVDIAAVLRTEEEADFSVGRGGKGGGSFRSSLAAGSAEVIIDRASYGGPMPEEGDTVRANDRFGQPWWTVANVDSRRSNLIILTLSQG